MKPVTKALRTKLRLGISILATLAIALGGFAMLSHTDGPDPMAAQELAMQADSGPSDFAAQKAAKRQAKLKLTHPRAEYWFTLLRDPATNRIPTDIHAREIAYAKTLPNRSDKALSLYWSEAGPNDVGGRTRAIAMDRTNTSTLLVGGTSGGLWKTTDDGTSWELKTPGHHSVTSIVQDPATSTTWYYSTGETGSSAPDRGYTAFYFGSGIYKSLDNGETWTQIQSAGSPVSWDSRYDYVSRIKINPITGSVFIASNGFGIYRSTDGGMSFSLVLGANERPQWSDFDFASDGTIVAVISEQGWGSPPDYAPGVYKSTDDGLTWTNITPATFPATHRRSVVAVAPSNPDLAYVMTDVASTDVRLHAITISTGASSDRSANLPDFGDPVGEVNTQGGWNMVFEVKPDDEDFVLFGWTNLYRSTDGVTTPMTTASTDWIGGYAIVNNISQYENHHPDNHAVAFDPTNPNRTWSGHDGGLSFVEDIRVSPVVWTDKNNAYNVTQFYTVGMHPAAGDPRMMGGTQDNGSPFFRIDPSSGTPSASRDISSGDGSFCYVGTSVLFCSSQSGGLAHYVYTSAGEPTYQGIIRRPTGASCLFVHPFTVDPADETKVLFPSADHFFRHNGTSWDELTDVATADGRTITALAVSPTDHTLYYAGYSSSAVPGIYRLDNADTATDGEVAIPIAGVPSGAYPHGIAINPDNSSEAMVVFSNYNITGLYHTQDGGATWTAVEGNLVGDASNPGPSIRGAAMRTTGGNVYLVATSTGVYSTDSLNGASTVWALEDPMGMGNVCVNALYMRASDGHVVAGTHGRGIFIGAKDEPVGAALAAFDLSSSDGRVAMNWRVNYGNSDDVFHVWRADGHDQVAGFARITDEALASSDDGSCVFVDDTAMPGRDYTYQVEIIQSSGASWMLASDSITVAGMPAMRIVMHGAHPNPFNPSTTISFELTRADEVDVSIYDISGRKVRTLVRGLLDATRHDVTWDGMNEQGRGVASGTYMYRITSATSVVGDKIMLLK